MQALYNGSMSAGDYLKKAASELRNGAAYLQRQASSLAAEEMREEFHVKNEMAKKQQHLKADQVSLGDKNMESHEKQRIERESKELEHKLIEEDQEIKHAQQRLGSESLEMQRSAQELLNKANELERMAGSPEYSK